MGNVELNKVPSDPNLADPNFLCIGRVFFVDDYFIGTKNHQPQLPDRTKRDSRTITLKNERNI